MIRPTRAFVLSALILSVAAAVPRESRAQGAPAPLPSGSATATPPAGTTQPLPPAPPAPTSPPTYPAPAPTAPRYGTYPPSAYPPGYTPPLYQPQPHQPGPQVPGQTPYQGQAPYQGPAQTPYPAGPTAPGYVYYNPWAHLPATLPVIDGKQPPAGYREETSVRRGFVITGAVAFGVSYGGALLAASAISDTDSDDYDGSSKRTESDALPLFLPCLGPFIGLATLDPSPLGTAWLLLDGLAQTAGLSLLIAGLASPNKKWIRADLGNASVRVVPIVTGSRSGLAVMAQF